MRIYFRQEMKYHYDKSKPLDDFLGEVYDV